LRWMHDGPESKSLNETQSPNDPQATRDFPEHCGIEECKIDEYVILDDPGLKCHCQCRGCLSMLDDYERTGTSDWDPSDWDETSKSS